MGKAGSKQTLVREDEDVKANHRSITFDIAITGMTGAGKSSLVNALRGMRTDEEAGAAVTDVIQCTMEPMAYVHPVHPEITMWDLPGIGTSEFEAKKYVKDMHFYKYDFFIIVSEDRFTEEDILLVREIQKIKKKFFYVRTKVDVSMNSERKNPDFNADKVLEKIRKYCCENLTKEGETSPRVFLISRWDLSMYDFPLLQKALWKEWNDFKRCASKLPLELKGKRYDRTNKPLRGPFLGSAISRTVLKIELDTLRLALEKDDLPDVIANIQQELALLKNATLDIAITGRSGAGKSSLTNALRAMTDYEKESAETGVTQTTMEPKPYPHPIFPKVTIWDLPGIGTREFKAKQYLKNVNFSRYDFFIIVSSGHFTENDFMLAHEIQKMQKRFYYVRTKVDVNVESEKKKQNFREDETLEKIRNDCSENLKKAGDSSPRVFLMSRWDLNLYDFPSLHDTMEEELDDLKRHAFILTSPIFSGEIIKKKKMALKTLTWKLALLSCFVGTFAVPGLSFACDIFILAEALIHFCRVFGLDEDSLRILANRVGKPVEELRSAIKNTPMPKNINPGVVLGLLSKSLFCYTLTMVELICNFVPVLGSIAGGASSFFCTFYLLRSFLQNVETDAANVRATASKQASSKRVLDKAQSVRNL
ncbi:interferon-inducible GTPase 5-like [Sceloporus undulatus]|uniref:interferon-inducible GTPase 5-like n=1 Tax=Sceloporus undulatus TaxID=8520 RepID=UPI001C4C192E|nr:interferon-inducible GTPase 5-like [Sceloporus undulatus]